MDTLVGALILLTLYFVPALIAWARGHNLGGVLIVNALLGWTLIGWVVALVMACGADRQVTVVHEYEHRFDPQTGERIKRSDAQLPPG